MNAAADILTFIIESIGGLFLLFIVLRFFLQLARADFYNPFSQAIVKITNPVLIPLRRIIPGLFGIDIASIILALLVQVIITETSALILFQTIISPLTAIVWAILGTLKLTTYVIFVCILIMVVTSFIAPHSNHPAIVLANQLMVPFTRPLQRILPPMGGLDLSVFFVGIGLIVTQKILDAFAQSAGLAPQLVIGY